VFPVQESFEASVQEKLICDKDQWLLYTVSNFPHDHM
jgi:hypothetical protein